MTRLRTVAAVLSGAMALASHAQNLLVNGDFETGQVSPWSVSPTVSGGTFGSSLALWDIDGPGPRAATPTLRCLVGQTTPNTGFQGVTVTQVVPVTEGVAYEVRLDWSVWALVNAHNATGGRFEIVVNGAGVASADAPVTAPNARTYGRVGGRFVAPSSDPTAVGVRIVRPTPLGEEVFQHVDNIRMRPACPGDVTENGSVGFDDLNAVLSEFGQAGAPGERVGDANFDGVVNFADLNLTLGAFGRAC